MIIRTVKDMSKFSDTYEKIIAVIEESKVEIEHIEYGKYDKDKIFNIQFRIGNAGFEIIYKDRFLIDCCGHAIMYFDDLCFIEPVNKLEFYYKKEKIGEVQC
jgi:hypothetical protein